MLQTASLFIILATLAKAAWKEGYAPADNTPCYVDGQHGSVKGALCVVSGLGLGKRLLGGLFDGNNGLLGPNGGGGYRDAHHHGLAEGDRCDVGGRYGIIKDTLCVIADVHVTREHDRPYGFGWFHPGPFSPGDRCWTGTGEGIIRDLACIDIGIGHDNVRNGWFDQPYYGYGHRFGWYHPGPFVEGDRCFENDQHGYVRNAQCATLNLDIDLGNVKRWYTNSPDYWYEPYFLPDHSFGWFHDGPFVDGDRCWEQGRYGSITNSLCVVAGLDVQLKRDLLGLGNLGLGDQQAGRPFFSNGDRCYKHNSWGLWGEEDCNTDIDLDVILQGRSLFKDGDRCWQQGRWGHWKEHGCAVDVDLNLAIGKRGIGRPFRDDPWLGRGEPCTRDGRSGILRDGLCLVAKLDVVVKRQDDGTVAEGAAEETQDGEASPENANADAPAGEEAPTGVTQGWEYDGQDLSGEGEALEKRLLSFSPGDGTDHSAGKTINDLLGHIHARGLIYGSDAGKPSPYGISAPPKGLLGEIGLDQIFKTRNLVGDKGFNMEDIIKTLGLEKRSLGGLGDDGLLGSSNSKGGLFGSSSDYPDLTGGLLGGSSKSDYSDLAGGLLGGGRKSGGQGRQGGLLDGLF